ncbi:MAG TPA: transglycosylase domain-containing protein, partial [Cyclobacteriaceae bacterium]|nr:transglycosylase domain-containing protein [Cyclobacteriaceae bacterium]
MLRWAKRHWKATGMVAVLLVAFVFCLPRPLFNDPFSTVLEDRAGNLLSASIAEDGQWRFPVRAGVPGKFEAAILQFEDKRFFSHWGVDPLAILRAIRQNVKAGS